MEYYLLTVWPCMVNRLFGGDSEPQLFRIIYDPIYLSPYFFPPSCPPLPLPFLTHPPSIPCPPPSSFPPPPPSHLPSHPSSLPLLQVNPPNTMPLNQWRGLPSPWFWIPWRYVPLMSLYSTTDIVQTMSWLSRLWSSTISTFLLWTRVVLQFSSFSFAIIVQFTTLHCSTDCHWEWQPSCRSTS